MSLAELLAAEHKSRLHEKLYQPPICIECFPDGPSTTTLAIGAGGANVPEVTRATQGAGPARRSRGEGWEPLAAGLRRYRAGITVDPRPMPYGPDQFMADGGPWCSTCKATRWVGQDLPPTHPEFGQAIACPGCFETFVLQRRLERLWGELPELFREWTIDSFRSLSRAHAHIAELQAGWLEEEGRPWLFLHGPAGRGKTGLAVALLDQLLRRRRTGTFKQSGALLRRIRQTYRSREAFAEDESSLLESLYAADVLVLDDLGAENTTDWAAETLFEVIGGRHDRSRQTIITSNWDLAQLRERIGTPTVSRIEEMVRRHIVDFNRLPYLRTTRQATE